MSALKKRILLFAALFALLVSAIAAGLLWHHRQNLLICIGEWVEARILKNDSAAKPPAPDAERYEVLCHQLEEWRSELAARHQQAQSTEDKAAIENEARIILEHTLPAMMRCWIGTKWDFNGTAAKPGKGKIACGYFVSTVLRDAGLQVNRYRLAQQASQHIIHTFLDPEVCTLNRGQDYQAFIQDMAQRPKGIYICGLDTHVGFIVNTDAGFRFIHSSGSEPWCVVDESPEEAKVLEASNWRMLGNLTADSDFIRTWLSGENIQVINN